MNSSATKGEREKASPNILIRFFSAIGRFFRNIGRRISESRLFKFFRKSDVPGTTEKEGDDKQRDKNEESADVAAEKTKEVEGENEEESKNGELNEESADVAAEKTKEVEGENEEESKNGELNEESADVAAEKTKEVEGENSGENEEESKNGELGHASSSGSLLSDDEEVSRSVEKIEIREVGLKQLSNIGQENKEPFFVFYHEKYDASLPNKKQKEITKNHLVRLGLNPWSFLRSDKAGEAADVMHSDCAQIVAEMMRDWCNKSDLGCNSKLQNYMKEGELAHKDERRMMGAFAVNKGGREGVILYLRSPNTSKAKLCNYVFPFLCDVGSALCDGMKSAVSTAGKALLHLLDLCPNSIISLGSHFMGETSDEQSSKALKIISCCPLKLLRRCTEEGVQIYYHFDSNQSIKECEQFLYALDASMSYCDAETKESSSFNSMKLVGQAAVLYDSNSLKESELSELRVALQKRMSDAAQSSGADVDGGKSSSASGVSSVCTDASAARAKDESNAVGAV